MANILHFTEQFDNAYWSGTSLVTANTAAAPSGFGVNAGLADTLEDNSAVAAQFLVSTYETIPNDSSDWLASLFVKKDAITSRFPRLVLQMNGGSGPLSGVSLNTSTGAVVEGGETFPATTAKGTVDYDALWWRVWWRVPNDSSSNTQARFFLAPGYTGITGDINDPTIMGSIIIWGANLTNTSTIQPYEPEPFYTFSTGLSWMGRTDVLQPPPVRYIPIQ